MPVQMFSPQDRRCGSTQVESCTVVRKRIYDCVCAAVRVIAGLRAFVFACVYTCVRARVSLLAPAVHEEIRLIECKYMLSVCAGMGACMRIQDLLLVTTNLPRLWLRIQCKCVWDGCSRGCVRV